MASARVVGRPSLDSIDVASLVRVPEFATSVLTTVRSLVGVFFRPETVSAIALLGDPSSLALSNSHVPFPEYIHKINVYENTLIVTRTLTSSFANTALPLGVCYQKSAKNVNTVITAALVDVNYQYANRLVDRLQQVKILKEMTGHRRNRKFGYGD